MVAHLSGKERGALGCLHVGATARSPLDGIYGRLGRFSDIHKNVYLYMGVFGVFVGTHWQNRHMWLIGYLAQTIGHSVLSKIRG